MLFQFLVLLGLLDFGGHNLHLTYGKVVVEEKVLYFKISFFSDDFELMLSSFHGKSVKKIAHNGDADSLLKPVLEKYLSVKLNSKTIDAEFIQSGTESDLCWYLLSYKSESAISELEIDNRLLFELYSDQKNLISFFDSRTEKKDSFYGTVGASVFSKDF